MVSSKSAVVGELEAFSKDSVDGVLELWERDWEQNYGNALEYGEAGRKVVVCVLGMANLGFYNHA